MPARKPDARAPPDEIAAAVLVWLLSYQSGYVHGAEIGVDGGITATRSI